MKKRRIVLGIVGAIIIIAVGIFAWRYALAFIDANGNRLQGGEALVALVVFVGGGLVAGRRWLAPKREKTPDPGSRLDVRGDHNTIATGGSVAVGGNVSGDIHIHHHPATPSRRGLFTFVGLLVGLAVDVLINLLAAGIQQNYFLDPFSLTSLLILGALAVFGALIGFWLSGPVTVPAVATMPKTDSAPTNDPQSIKITRFQALLSYGKLRGYGITLSDILLIASKLDIDTRSYDDPTSYH